MTSETIQISQKVYFTRDCGKTWQLGTLASFTEKTVTVNTRAYETVTVRYGFLNLRKKTVRKGIVKPVKLDYAIACNSVISLGQYAAMRETAKLEREWVSAALKYAA